MLTGGPLCPCFDPQSLEVDVHSEKVWLPKPDIRVRTMRCLPHSLSLSVLVAILTGATLCVEQ